MNKPMKPAVAIFMVLAVLGGAVAVMFYFADKKGPPLPTGMGAAMSAEPGGAGAGTPRAAPAAPRAKPQGPDASTFKTPQEIDRMKSEAILKERSKAGNAASEAPAGSTDSTKKEGSDKQ